MQIIKQRTSRDCGICSIAMYTGLSYEEVIRRVGDYYDYSIGLFVRPGMWERLGYFAGPIPRPECGEKALIRFRVREGFNHMVYWDGWEIRDPGHSGRFGTLWGDSRILRLVALNSSKVAHVGVPEPASQRKV